MAHAGGRPPKEFDKVSFEKLCGLMCTKEEICSFLGMSDKTLDKYIKQYYDRRSFSEVYNMFRSMGKISVRRNQMKLSEKSAAMAIWLGKVYLGQTDVNPAEALTENNDVLQSILDVEKKRKKAHIEDYESDGGVPDDLEP